MRTDLQDCLTALSKVPLLGAVQLTKGHREFYTGNYRAIINYLGNLEEVRIEIAQIACVDLQMVKPEPSLVRNGGPSTIWQIVKEKVEFALPAFVPLLTRDIAFRKLSDWDQLCVLLRNNMQACLTAYVENKFIFSTFAAVEKSAQRGFSRRYEENKYGEARARIMGDGQERRGLLSTTQGARPPLVVQKQTVLNSVGYAGGFGNVTTLIDDVRSDSDSEEEFASARSEEQEIAPDDILNLVNQDVQQALTSLHAVGVHKGTPAMSLARPPGPPGPSACFHNMLGKCSKGSDCTFSHDKSDSADLLKILQNNHARHYGTTTLSSMVDELTSANVMRIRVQCNDAVAIALVDTGAVLSFVAKRYCTDQGITLHRAKSPLRVDLAGTGVIKTLSHTAKLCINTLSPISKTKSSFHVEA